MRGSSPPAVISERMSLDPGESEELDIKNDKGAKRLRVDDFELLGVLGRGSYGKVFQVRMIRNQKIFAMKVLRKKDVIKRKVVTHTRAERSVLEEINHPFIVNLRYAFQTDSKLYLVLDYVGGGELFTRLDEELELPEDVTKFYAASVVLALEHLHKKNIVYRDLKPENILFHKDGYICLTDFGFAKREVSSYDLHVEVVEDDGTKTFCGTVHYMAPEIILKTGHGKPADWWAVGVLIYEMLTGRTPFHDQNRKNIQQKIINNKMRPPKWVSQNGQNLLKGLLKKNIKARLGTAGSEEIKNHPWFSDINWDDVYNKRIPAPFIPKTDGVLDISRFDDKFTKEPPVDSPSTPADLGNIFDGFSFNNAPSPSHHAMRPRHPGSPHHGFNRRSGSMSTPLGSPSYGPRLGHGHAVIINNMSQHSPWGQTIPSSLRSPPRFSLQRSPKGFAKSPPKMHLVPGTNGQQGAPASSRKLAFAKPQDKDDEPIMTNKSPTSAASEEHDSDDGDENQDGRHSRDDHEFSDDELFVFIPTGKKKKTRRGGKKKNKVKGPTAGEKPAEPNADTTPEAKRDIVVETGSVGKDGKNCLSSLNPNAKPFVFGDDSKYVTSKATPVKSSPTTPTLVAKEPQSSEPLTSTPSSGTKEPIRQLGFQPKSGSTFKITPQKSTPGKVSVWGDQAKTLAKIGINNAGATNNVWGNQAETLAHVTQTPVARTITSPGNRLSSPRNRTTSPKSPNSGDSRGNASPSSNNVSSNYKQKEGTRSPVPLTTQPENAPAGSGAWASAVLMGNQSTRPTPAAQSNSSGNVRGGTSGSSSGSGRSLAAQDTPGPSFGPGTAAPAGAWAQRPSILSTLSSFFQK